MQRTIIYILGTSYSGSSLLNSVLDSQPKTRGLGEAVHLVHKPTNAWCGNCLCHVDQCRLQSDIRTNQFYESVFDAYPESDVIVNSSKHWGQCFHYMPIPSDEFRLCLIVLSKSLEEFAYSYAAHQGCSHAEGFGVWVDFYQQMFRNMDGVLKNSPETDIQRRLISRFAKNDVAHVTYRELATETDKTIERLCAELSVPFDSGYRERLFRGDTCTIGGNNAIYAQRSGNAAFFQPQRDYLNGKYSGRQGAVFYDDAWLDDHDLLRSAQDYCDANERRVACLRRRLGHVPRPLSAQAIVP